MKGMNKVKWQKLMKDIESEAFVHDDNAPVTKVTPAKRCTSKKELFSVHCCGVAGHKGMHWCYKEDGSLCWWPNTKKALKPWQVAFSTTPPGHSQYISPEKKAKDYYRSHNKVQVIKPKKRKKP